LRKVQPGHTVYEMTQRLLDAISPRSAALKMLRKGVGLSQAKLGKLTGYSGKTIYRWERGWGQPRKVVMEFLSDLQSTSNEPDGHAEKFRFIDLFAGIGGTRLGFQRAGGKCVFTSEWDKYAQRTYRTNFGDDHSIAGDITQVASDQIPEHDVLVAGFPCQPFSIAGVSKKNSLGRAHGFACETQGTLFFEVARIIRDLRPKAFLLENVKNLRTHDRGRTLATILKVLEEELGYSVYPQVVDAAAFVPQHRERIFLVGFDRANDFSWEDIDFGANRPSLRTVLHPEDGSEPGEAPFTNELGQVSDKYYLTEHLWEYLQKYAAKHKQKGNGFGYGLVGPDDVARTLSARYYKDGSEILIKTARSTPRRLTPRECARLMGFDRGGERPFRIQVSDTQAYKQFGNSVVVPVIETIARAMRPYIMGPTEDRLQLHLNLRLRAG
jgi:DNA (cytosine-5)-methyltransferase 1